MEYLNTTRSFSAKDDIRALLVTDPAKRMTIHSLMQTPLVTGEEPPKGIDIPGIIERESSEEPDSDEVCLIGEVGE